MTRIVIFVFASLVMGCTAIQSWLTAEVVRDGNVRLSRDVQPERYRLDLAIEPSLGTYSGQVEIDVQLNVSTDVLLMHGGDVEIDNAVVETSTRIQGPQIVLGTNGALTLKLRSPLPPGPATLRFSISGMLSDSADGLFRFGERGEWYAFTQFEPRSARRVFPCFDQPEFKTPFEISIRVPTGLVAVSNAPEKARETRGDQTTFQFEETAPISTYLVAFAAGKFDIVSADTTELGGLPFRIITTQGKGSLAQYALREAPVIYRGLAAYLGHSSPFAKLDFIAVPSLEDSAMENVGLVSFRESLLLVGSDPAPIKRRWSQSVVAHELSHIWFGNSVSIDWWDSVWMKEAAATWLAIRTRQSLDESGQLSQANAAGNAYLVLLDSREDARAVSESIDHGFTGVAYGKGAAVLQMVESFVGDAVFQSAIQSYLRTFVHQAVTPDEMFSVLDRHAGSDIAPIMRSYLEQPGVPVVRMSLRCEGDGEVQLRLRQERHLPAGVAPAADALWHIPVCVRFGTESTAHRQCIVLKDREQTSPLSAQSCPNWLHGNADQMGYYHWTLDGLEPSQLTGAHFRNLTARERAALPSFLKTQLVGGAIELPAYLTALENLARMSEPIVLKDVVSSLYRLSHLISSPKTREDFSRWVRALLRPHFRDLGSATQQKVQSEFVLKPTSFTLPLAFLGRDPDLLTQARAAAHKFVQNPNQAARDGLTAALPVAARDGDLALWLSLRKILTSSDDPVLRVTVMRALGAFEDPELLTRSLDLVLDGTLTPEDFRSLVSGVHSQTRDSAWMWMTRNHEAILQRLGDESKPILVSLGSGFCTDADRDRVESFFSSPRYASPAMVKTLVEVVERISRCSRLRARVGSQMMAWLDRRGTATPRSE